MENVTSNREQSCRQSKVEITEKGTPSKVKETEEKDKYDERKIDRV